MKPPSKIEARLADQLREAGLSDGCYRETRFHPERRWRLDLSWPDLLIGVEVEGGLYVQGAHNRGPQIESDCLKIDEAQVAGWLILRVTEKMIRSGVALDLIRRAIDLRRGYPTAVGSGEIPSVRTAQGGTE